jgi:propionyl-CoA carboxylase beta chain
MVREGRHTSSQRWLETLFDPGTQVDIDVFGPSEGPAAGFGAVDGREVAACWLGGPLREAGTAIVLKVQELAVRSLVPMVLVDSGGERVHEDLVARAGFAQILRAAAESSGVVPQVAILSGHPARETRLMSALSDFVVGFQVPVSSEADLEGATAQEAVEIVRRLLGFLPSSHVAAPPVAAAPAGVSEPDPSLQGMAPVDGSSAVEMRTLVERIVDSADFLEVRAGVAPAVVTGFARLGGHPLGVVACGGGAQLDASGCAKAARFVRFCDAFGMPVVTLVDAGGADDPVAGAKLVYAYAEATVPKLAVVLRRQHGTAFQLLSPWLAGADLNLAWPTAEIADGGAERGYVDDLIEPRMTRPMLLRGLELCLRKVEQRPSRKHGNPPL